MKILLENIKVFLLDMTDS